MKYCFYCCISSAVKNSHRFQTLPASVWKRRSILPAGASNKVSPLETLFHTLLKYYLRGRKYFLPRRLCMGETIFYYTGDTRLLDSCHYCLCSWHLQPIAAVSYTILHHLVYVTAAAARYVVFLYTAAVIAGPARRQLLQRKSCHYLCCGNRKHQLQPENLTEENCIYILRRLVILKRSSSLALPMDHSVSEWRRPSFGVVETLALALAHDNVKGTQCVGSQTAVLATCL